MAADARDAPHSRAYSGVIRPGRGVEGRRSSVGLCMPHWNAGCGPVSMTRTSQDVVQLDRDRSRRGGPGVYGAYVPRSKQPPSPAPPETAFIVIDGRRWRTSDPRIPDNLRQELVNELMAARRAVRDAEDQLALRSSRGRVNDAKIALGERGHAWWLPPEPAATARRIDAAMRALLGSRMPGRTICPSDIARIVGGTSWRTLLPVVRDRAVAMTERGELEILRRGAVVTENPTQGVLRYRLTPRP